MKKVIIGMSGGVDSSVTAYLLKEQGYNVEGVSFILYGRRLKNTTAGCCSIEAINDAIRTSRAIGIRHNVLDLREEFADKVIKPFIDAYEKGITPNPCILCNKHIKFPYLLKVADEKGFDFIATGHYARVKDSNEGQATKNSNKGQVTSNELKKENNNSKNLSLVTRYSSLNEVTRYSLLNKKDSLLLKGIDGKKDQSYVLYILTQDQLRRLKLPLGDRRKDEVREIAGRLNLPAVKRKESQEICFVEERNYFKFFENQTTGAEGPLIDIESGRILGAHNGIHLYTIGQRKRLGIALGKPAYVVRIDPSKKAVYIGPKDLAMMKEFIVEDINWLIKSAEAQKCRSAEVQKNGRVDEKDFNDVTSDLPRFKATVKVRSTMKDEPAAIHVLDENRVRVIYDEPQWAPAPGQSAVFYDEDTVIGGGVIEFR